LHKDRSSFGRLVGFRLDVGAELLEVIYPKRLPGLGPMAARKLNLGSRLFSKETQP